MKPEQEQPKTNLSNDLKAFEQLPTQTKKLLILQDQTEKSTGQERVDLQKMTRDKLKQADPRLQR